MPYIYYEWIMRPDFQTALIHIAEIFVGYYDSFYKIISIGGHNSSIGDIPCTWLFREIVPNPAKWNKDCA